MLEAYEKELDKKATPEAEQVPRWQKTTLKEILSKKEDGDLFGEMLGREGDLELSQRIAKGELTEDDIEELDTHRLDFLSTMQEVKVTKESITNDVVNAYTRNNPELQKVVGLVGLDSYREIVKDKLAGLAIRDPEAFASLSGAVKDKNEFKAGIYKELDDEVTKLCADKKIKPESYMKAVAIEDPEERAEALKLAVKEGFSNWQKAGNWFTGGSWAKRRAELMGSKKEELDLATEAMKLHRSNIGEFLAGMTDVPEIRSAVAKELIGEEEKKVPLQGFKESKGQMPTKESFQASWAEYKKNRKKKDKSWKWEDLTPRGKEKERDKFIEEQNRAQAEEMKKKAGIWGAIFGLLSGEYYNNNKAELK